MTRPKVPEDKRQRIAQACDTCKRRKQKCNGLQPCNPCTKRNAHCTYSATEPPGTDNLSPFRPPFKRRHVETAAELGSHHDLLANLASGGQDDDMESQMLDDFGSGSHQITPFGQDEETHVYGQPRLLQDPTGRLLEGVAGPSQFTMDPDRHKFTEPTLTVPETARNIHMLPEKKAADVLVQYFFTNTHGLMDILDRREFKQSLNLCYSSPLTVESSDLCLVYLVLAIGLAMASPIPGSPEHDIVIHLRSQPVDQAEVFFRSAKGLGDPVSGFEDGNFWSIQALCLMSVYMLAVSKRNAAYAYLGQHKVSNNGLCH
ncbi:hypothetical protein G7Z17_g11055 [Cylindrodendrum hubeiense]|uniref:Zn(2)-C6 fungal-type domain-containing protein n=1 Tax=Cylindrodendrum hubeiense TaxID=595255 RepID=A0A9P5H5X1_9HYPO|nr:hypothetical protein G7Z17_g11055 [Cylindrodendrum hubeiense]